MFVLLLLKSLVVDELDDLKNLRILHEQAIFFPERSIGLGEVVALYHFTFGFGPDGGKMLVDEEFRDLELFKRLELEVPVEKFGVGGRVVAVLLGSSLIELLVVAEWRQRAVKVALLCIIHLIYLSEFII